MPTTFERVILFLLFVSWFVVVIGLRCGSRADRDSQPINDVALRNSGSDVLEQLAGCVVEDGKTGGAPRVWLVTDDQVSLRTVESEVVAAGQPLRDDSGLSAVRRKDVDLGCELVTGDHVSLRVDYQVEAPGSEL